jgi:hypothetical protein
MIISKNREKVKRKALILIQSIKSGVSKPEKKFLSEMSMGMLLSGSSNISEIARTLGESTALKHTTKRLERMLTHDHLLDACNQLCLEEASSKIDDQTILAFDGGDVTHQYGEKFELLNYVHDGSHDKREKGYWLNQISGYNPSTQETFPVALDIYSSSEAGFKSENNESINLVDSVLGSISPGALWVMDRGYDRSIILDYFLSNQLNFVIRMNSGSNSRHILVGDQSVNITVAAKSINRRVVLNENCRFGSLKVELKIGSKRYPVTLICFKDKRNDEPILWLSNGWIKSTKELKRRIRGYFRRWGVEECYRFEKQGFGIEKATLRKFSRIKTLIGLTLFSWLVLIKINDTGKLKEVVLKAAKMAKTKLKHRPKFIYYRLLKGVQRLFAGVSELFRFRWKRHKKIQYKKEVENQRLLFPDLPLEQQWIELAA